MSNPSLLSITAVLIVSCISFAGIALFSLSESAIRKSLLYLVSLAAGVLFGEVFLHILPEITEKTGMTVITSIGILIGIIASFVIEKIIHWHHCHVLPSSDHHHPVGMLTLVGDGIHNIVDGALIAGSFLVSPELGIATTIAIALHEIPQEISDYALLIYSGYSRNKALLWNFVSALASVLGAVFVLLGRDEHPEFLTLLMAFAAGNFLYIAGADLIPELHKETRLRSALIQLLLICSGIGLMQALTLLE
ncbi:MAG: zinc/iron permease [Candidatus Peregrinibacteria bacterium Greene0416_62]|nr:MAG: zinc/iron permease [Candidatus Peregrinibacteria bacterium Greene0416_62]TSC98132.1 MAG: zinc/iron permease [Candidatus Peregrinibacteria bacterium Greene1014_49]